MSEQGYLILAVSFILILLLIYFFGRWRLRRLFMKRLAKRLGLVFEEKEDRNFKLSGKYNNRNIVITENATLMYSGSNFVSAKSLNIKIDDKIIYSKEGEILFPLPRKIKKVLDNYIKTGIMPRNFLILKWILVVSLFLILFFLQIMMRQ